MNQKQTDEHLPEIKKGRKKKDEMKILQITDDYRVTSDSIQFTIERKKKDGSWENVGYYTNIKSVIYSLCQKVTKDHLDSMIYVAGEIDKIMKVVSDYENLDKLKQ